MLLSLKVNVCASVSHLWSRRDTWRYLPCLRSCALSGGKAAWQVNQTSGYTACTRDWCPPLQIGDRHACVGWIKQHENRNIWHHFTALIQHSRQMFYAHIETNRHGQTLTCKTWENRHVRRYTSINHRAMTGISIKVMFLLMSALSCTHLETEKLTILC